MKYLPIFNFLAIALASDLDLKPLCEEMSNEYKVACKNTSELVNRYFPQVEGCFNKCTTANTKCDEECFQLFYNKISEEPKIVKALECIKKCEKDTDCISKCPDVILNYYQMLHAFNCSSFCNKEPNCTTKCSGNLFSPELNRSPNSSSREDRNTTSTTSIVVSGTRSVTSITPSNTDSISPVVSINDASSSKASSSAYVVKVNSTFSLFLSICLAFIIKLFIC